MTVLALKEQLISKINITTNEDILNGMLRFLEFETENEDVYFFSEIEQKAIEEAQLQVKEGKFYTDEEVDKLTGEWLKK